MLDLKNIQNTVDRILMEMTNEYFASTNAVSQCIMTHPLSRILGGIPFICKSKFPERYAVANLSILIFASTNLKKYFACQHGETIASRLKVLNRFERPKDTRAINKAFLIMELYALADYKKDKEEDEKNRKYNPLNDDKNFENEQKRLFSRIKKYKTPCLDEFLNFSDPQDYYDNTIQPLSLRNCLWFCEVTRSM
jgi:hypothetical protein